MAWEPTVINAITIAVKPANANTPAYPYLYAKFCDHVCGNFISSPAIKKIG